MSASASTLTRWSDLPLESLNPHIGRQFVTTPTTMLARIFLAKGGVVPLHSHANEQITYVLEGALKFHLHEAPGGDPGSPPREITVHAGEVLTIPPNIPHAAFALEDTVDLDIFNPPRQDWIDGTDAYLRTPAS